jgi:hypothetical protein
MALRTVATKPIDRLLLCIYVSIMFIYMYIYIFNVIYYSLSLVVIQYNTLYSRIKTFYFQRWEQRFIKIG